MSIWLKTIINDGDLCQLGQLCTKFAIMMADYFVNQWSQRTKEFNMNLKNEVAYE